VLQSDLPIEWPAVLDCLRASFLTQITRVANRFVNQITSQVVNRNQIEFWDKIRSIITWVCPQTREDTTVYPTRKPISLVLLSNMPAW